MSVKRLVAAAFVTGALLTPTTAFAAGPPAGVRECPRGYVGVIVYRGDYNTGGPIDLVTVCLPLEP